MGEVVGGQNQDAQPQEQPLHQSSSPIVGCRRRLPSIARGARRLQHCPTPVPGSGRTSGALGSRCRLAGPLGPVPGWSLPPDQGVHRPGHGDHPVDIVEHMFVISPSGLTSPTPGPEPPPAGHLPARRRGLPPELAERARPVSSVSVRLLPLPAPLSPLFPDGALRRGSTTVVTGAPGRGATTLALALLAAASTGAELVRRRSGWPIQGWWPWPSSASTSRRVVFVPDPRAGWADAAAELALDGVDVVLVRPPAGPGPPPPATWWPGPASARRPGGPGRPGQELARGPRRSPCRRRGRVVRDRARPRPPAGPAGRGAGDRPGRPAGWRPHPVAPVRHRHRGRGRRAGGPGAGGGRVPVRRDGGGRGAAGRGVVPHPAGGG